MVVRFVARAVVVRSSACGDGAFGVLGGVIGPQAFVELAWFTADVPSLSVPSMVRT